MGTINHGYIDRVKYILECEKLNSSMLITEPIGWNEDNKEFARNGEYDGIVAKFSNSLKFVGNGADYIQLAYELHDVMANIKLTKYEKHPKTDKWIKIYWGYLDLMTRKVERNQVSVKFNSGGLQEDLKSREDASFEMDRTTTIDGISIKSIEEQEVYISGRRIFLKSKWDAKNIENNAILSVSSKDGNTRNQTHGIPFSYISQSHEQGQNVLPESIGTEDVGTAGMMFLANFDRTREIIIKGSGISFKAAILKSDWELAFFTVRLTTYANGGSYNAKSSTILFHAGVGSATIPDLWDINNQTITIPDFNIPITVNEGESVAMEFYIKANLKDLRYKTATFKIAITNIKGSFLAEEDSSFDASTAKCYLVHDVLDHLASICSNSKKVFYSDYFGRKDLGYEVNGFGAFIGLTHGFALRGFNKLPIPDPDNGIENLYKPMTTSLRDAFTSLKSVFNIGVGIEEINGKERIRVEDMSFFYNNNVTVKLPNQVKKITRSTASDYYWPSIEIGYEKGGENEEAQGLDEPNGRSNFTTFINKGKNSYSQLSKYIGGMYPKEFTRRKPRKKYPTEDTKYDNDIFLLDLKRATSGLFEERKWQDDFSKQPTGIFSPETATNLRLSPVNMLLRHGWLIATALTKFATEKIRYSSSTANSQLKTQLKTQSEYSENGDIFNSELTKPRFVPEWIEFEHECTFDLMQLIQSSTLINGKLVQNFYGTFEFINEKNQTEKGFLFNLKPNEGKWKLLKANR
ncbi:hypothetical protein [Flavobacterium crassostreae]|uniref:Uncharacterized protein n=1 Tax=Flavobacterium crassostreae TaxID=1763534 RepID=A0A1B9E7V7_9FLAO|nr:hypothetical protein [Flavobacterium crassostreae]OCB77948.1 hypothetical protein LPBF_03100 [Flavobacterium crassostreae]